PSDNSNFASLQSGRMLENICLCFTWPAMMARATPSLWNVSISFDNSPSEIQCRRISESCAARSLISGSISSLIAATTTRSPLARAASRTKKGKRPLPAIRPSGPGESGDRVEESGDRLIGSSGDRKLALGFQRSAFGRQPDLYVLFDCSQAFLAECRLPNADCPLSFQDSPLRSRYEFHQPLYIFAEIAFGF